MSSTSQRRKQYDYRSEYIKHNKGFFFGTIYFCAICGKPITKENMEVDHIIPLNKKGINHISNCVATCKKCNRAKSDKLDNRCFVQFIWKVVEELLVAIRLLITSIFKYSKIAVLYPIEQAKTTKEKMIVYFIYLLIIGMILLNYGGNYVIRKL